MSNTNPIVFWDKAHKDADIKALSGHSLDTHLDVLKIRDFLPKCKSVLCIGISNGQWIRDLANQCRGLTIECMDISPKAFDCVPMLRCFSPTDFYAIDQMSRYDLIISFWVSPHMTDPQLEQQLHYTVKALTANGIFALQYNEPINIDDKELAQYMHTTTAPNTVMSAGLFCRTPDHIHSMVKLAGGEVVDRMEGYLVDGGKEIEAIVHIARSTS